MSLEQPQVNIPTPSTQNKLPPKPYYFVNRDSFVKEDTDIDVGYYIHKQKLGEGLLFSLLSFTHFKFRAFRSSLWI